MIFFAFIFMGKISNSHIKVSSVQNIKVFNNTEVIARISSSEINRISIPNYKIESYQIAKGEATITPDVKKGEIYLSLIYKNSTKPINLFISSETGSTFKVLLIPKKITSQQIFLIENKPNLTTSNYQNNDQELINFFKDISANKIPQGYEAKYSKKRVKFRQLQHKYPILKDLKITKLTTIESNQSKTYIGQKFTVQNKSKNKINLKEHYFYQDGTLAVNLTQRVIEPKSSVVMYVISLKP